MRRGHLSVVTRGHRQQSLLLLGAGPVEWNAAGWGASHESASPHHHRFQQEALCPSHHPAAWVTPRGVELPPQKSHTLGWQRAFLPVCRIHRDFGPLDISKAVGSSEQSTLSYSMMWIFVWTIYPSPFKSCPSSFGHLNTSMSARCAASSVCSVSDLKEGKMTAFFKDVLTASFCHWLLI